MKPLYRSRIPALAIAVAGSLVAIATPVQAADPMVGAPEVGACYNVTLKQYNNDEVEPAVDCAETHTAITVHVGLLPDSLDWDSGRTKLGKAVYSACSQPLKDAFGQTQAIRRMSMFDQGWNFPTDAQKDEGARWFRCDALVWDPAQKKLAPIPSTDPLIDMPLKSVFRRCLTGNMVYTRCTSPHRYRAETTYKVSGNAYPGVKKLRKIALKQCGRLIKTRWFAYSLPHDWMWDLDDDHLIVCYSKHTSRDRTSVQSATPARAQLGPRKWSLPTAPRFVIRHK